VARGGLRLISIESTEEKKKKKKKRERERYDCSCNCCCCVSRPACPFLPLHYLRLTTRCTRYRPPQITPHATLGTIKTSTAPLRNSHVCTPISKLSTCPGQTFWAAPGPRSGPWKGEIGLESFPCGKSRRN